MEPSAGEGACGFGDERLVTLAERLEQRLAQVEGKVAALEGREDAVAALEERVRKLEESLERALEAGFPRVEALLQKLESLPLPALKPSASIPPPEVVASTSARTSVPRDGPQQRKALGQAVSEAAERGRTPDDQRILSQNADIHYQDETSASIPPPEVVASTSARTCVPRVDPQRKKLGQALLEAAKEGRTQDVQRILSQNADVHYQDEAGRTPLHCAAGMGHVDVISLLLAAGAQPDRCSPPTCRTPLFDASLLEKDEAVRALVDAGADPNARDNAGNCPLHVAATRGRARAVGALVAAGADVNLRGSEGMAPLHCAVRNCDEEVLEELIAAGADVNARNNKGEAPLHLAALFRRWSAVGALLSAGALKTVRNNFGRLPFDYAKNTRCSVLKP